MMREKNNHVKFVVKNSDYATSLCPGTSTDNKRSIGIPIRDVISLSLEERLIKWLSEGRQVNRFAALLHLDPTISIKDDLLRILPLYAYLVQGLWVSKSSLICKGFEALVRDYIIFLFSKNKTIRYDKRKSPIPPVVRHYLSQLAFQRPLFSDLKFREATDLSFIKAYPHAVKEQECAWSSREQELLESFRGSFRNMMEKQAVDFLMNGLNPKLVKKVTSSAIADPGHKKDINMMASSTGMTVPSSSQEELVKVLLEVFRLHSVRSLGSIKQALQGRGIDPPPELISVLGQITENVHGVYVSKSAGNPDLHALRTVIIKLFMENKPNAKLRNNQIVAAVRSSLNRNFSADEYKQVVNGLCINKDGWMLKDGEC
ncbi:DNA-directed RNA polymerase III subunit RPC5 isoform X1 [Iris pallida]|nr:DNA-directed RNA polymerase III subunit RPC5 isoform X1 [Iris pallida]